VEDIFPPKLVPENEMKNAKKIWHGISTLPRPTTKHTK
jgi:hypothetical protein